MPLQVEWHDGLAGSEKIILNCKKKSETYQLFPNHNKNYLFMTRETEKKVFLETKKHNNNLW